MNDEEDSLLTEDKDRVSFSSFRLLKLILYRTLTTCIFVCYNIFRIIYVLGTNTGRIEAYEF